MLPTMILCAGLGTRLRPLTVERAKPLVPVGDRPVLEHVLERARVAASRIVVNAHHRVRDVTDFAGPRGFVVSEEPELLGTAGGVAKAAPLLGVGDVLVWNGDILCALDAAALERAHRDAGDTVATLAVRPLARGEGNVGLDDRGRVVRLRLETVRSGEARGGEFLGIHVLGEALRRGLPAKGCLVGDVYLPALRRGAEIGAFCTDVPFFDVGTLASYVAANVAWLGEAACWRGPGASVADGARLDRVVVGDGARVEGEGRLARVVVWPGAVARAPLAGAVVTPSRVVAVTD